MFEVCNSCVQCCFIIHQNCISCNCVSAVDVIVCKLWYWYYSYRGMILRYTRLMSYASPSVMSNSSSYNCMPGENYHVEGRYDDSSMELVGLDCFLNFSVCSITIIQLCFCLLCGVSLWCLILTQTTTITSVKKQLLKVIHGNFNSSENLCRLKPLPIIPQKTFLNKMYLFSNFFDDLLTTVHQNVESVVSFVVNNIIRNITYQAFYIF